MSTESISRRLKAIEAKVVPRMSPMKRMLVELPEFERLISGFGLDFEEIKALPGALDGFPRDALRLLVDRLRIVNTRC